jgi:micrococcal nuclease
MYQYKATIIRVIDGDTVDVEIDLGFDIKQKTRLRLYGINAPELKGPSSKAGHETKTYVESILTEGKEILVETFKDKKEKYGRYLAVIKYVEGDINEQGLEKFNLNEQLILKGLAIKYMAND